MCVQRLSGTFWPTLALSDSLWLSLALSGSLWLSLALSGSLWLSLALSGSLWLPLAPSGSLWLSQALSGSLLLSEFANKAVAWLGTPFLSSSTLISPELIIMMFIMMIMVTARIRRGVVWICITDRTNGHSAPALSMDGHQYHC